MPDIKFSIRKNRIDKSLVRGLNVYSDGCLSFDSADTQHYAHIYPLDSGQADMEWGRFHANIKCAETQIYYIFVFATNETIMYNENDSFDVTEFLQDPQRGSTEKESFLYRVDAKRYVNQDDFLMYGLKGRYLYISIFVMGEGEFSISDMQLDQEGDIMLNLVPEVYHNRGDFFHNFISIFASIYFDTHNEIEALPELLNLDTCPKELLHKYAGWLGIDIVGDYLDEDTMRMLVKEAWQLNRMKGSKWAVERLIEIILKEKPIIIEQNTLLSYEASDTEEAMAIESVRHLLHKKRFEVTVLVKKQISEEERYQLFHLLNQFKPIRSNFRIIQLTDNSILDGNSYLDLNATIYKNREATMDEYNSLDSMLVLSE
ncbi:MAG: phage tail protein [Lachnospiraceae bacterium]|nr:phage tail protein [Lachnospiraceae bacterium]